MKAMYKRLLIYLLIVELIHAEPVAIVAGVVGLVSVLGGLGWTYFHSRGHERCDSKWVQFNATGLQADLKRKLFGQHIASPVILKAVTGFMNDPNPPKPLVLSLHGWSGTGKNFASQMIAENIYKEGMNSSFVHLFTEVNFPHSHEVEKYKVQLRQKIKTEVSRCPRSLFIFDEMDKMHPGLIDSIMPYLEYYKVDGVSNQKAIFILLSNAGGESIMNQALDFWKNNRYREEIQLKDMEEALSLSVYNNKQSGLWHTRLIEKNLVDWFVPFLPLEQRHVIQCVLASMEAKGLRPDLEVADRLARELMYIRPDKVFSKPGCKTIYNKLKYYV